MPYRIAGIDVHKKMLAVVVADVEVDGDFDVERQKAGTTPTDLRGLADWLVEHEVEEVALLESGKIRVVIDKVYPLSDAASAVSHMFGHHATGESSSPCRDRAR